MGIRTLGAGVRYDDEFSELTSLTMGRGSPLGDEDDVDSRADDCQVLICWGQRDGWVQGLLTLSC